MLPELVPVLQQHFQSLISEAGSPPSIQHFLRARAILEDAVKAATADIARQVNTESSINSLPIELLTHVFNFLQRTDRSACALVCSHWRSGALAPSLWKHLICAVYPDISEFQPTIGTLLRRAAHLDVAIDVDLPCEADKAFCATLARDITSNLAHVIQFRLTAFYVPDNGAADRLIDLLRYGSVERISTLELTLHTTPTGVQENMMLIPLNRFTALRAVSIDLKGPMEFLFDTEWTSKIGALRLAERMGFSRDDSVAFHHLIVSTHELEQLNVQNEMAFERFFEEHSVPTSGRLRCVYFPPLQFLPRESIIALYTFIKARGLPPMTFVVGNPSLRPDDEWSPLEEVLPASATDFHYRWYLSFTPEISLVILRHQDHRSWMSVQFQGADGETWIFPRLVSREANALLTDPHRRVAQRLSSLSINLLYWPYAGICDCPLLRDITLYVDAVSHGNLDTLGKPPAHKPFSDLPSLVSISLVQQSAAGVSRLMAPSTKPLHTDFAYLPERMHQLIEVEGVMRDFIRYQLGGARLPLDSLMLKDVLLLPPIPDDEGMEVSFLAGIIKNVVIVSPEYLAKVTPVPFVFAHDLDVAWMYCTLR